jgi:hypothetical protein
VDLVRTTGAPVKRAPPSRRHRLVAGGSRSPSRRRRFAAARYDAPHGPGSELGLEAASVFAVFTSQAWNLTFSFCHSLASQPGEFNEASKLMGLSRWKRFWAVDVPSGAIGLVWNGMMSFGGSGSS